MKWLKQIAGGLAVALGVVGVIACLGGAVTTWRTRARVDTTVTAVCDRVNGALVRVEGRAHEMGERIETTRDSARSLNERVQTRIAEWRDVPPEAAPDIDEIERQLYARLQLGREWIEFMQSTFDLVEQLLQMVESTSLFLQADPDARAGLLTAIRAASDEFDETTALARTVKTHLAEIRAHRDIEANAERITTLSSLIDTSLVKIEGHADTFETGLAKTQTGVTDLGLTIRRHTRTAAMVATLMLIWAGVAQVTLGAFGWRLLRHYYR